MAPQQPSHGAAREGLTRRTALVAGGLALAKATFASAAPPATAPTPATRPAFAQRGYYLTFMRMPTFGLTAWKRAVDCFAADGVNLLILWMAGGFRSKKFPVTWRYNEAHETSAPISPPT